MPPNTPFFEESRPTKYSDFDATTRTEIAETRICSNFPPRPPASDVSTVTPSTSNIPTTINGNPSLPPPPIPSLLDPDFNAYLPTTLIANVRSLVPKVDELEQTIKMNDVDMICLTETWLHPSILDSALFLSNYVLFRRDRLSSIGGGVCIYVNAKLHCRRLIDFESPSIESMWLSIRPRYLPRSISVILLAVIYHSTSAGAMENSELYDHIQSNVDSYLSRHPDFNPVSTGFDEKLLNIVWLASNC